MYKKFRFFKLFGPQAIFKNSDRITQFKRTIQRIPQINCFIIKGSLAASSFKKRDVQQLFKRFFC